MTELGNMSGIRFDLVAISKSDKKGGSNNYIIVIPANAGIPCSCG